MSKSIRRLGRGLDSLVTDLRAAPPDLEFPGEDLVRNEAAESTGVRTGKRTGTVLPVGALQPNPFQPRKEFDAQELDALATSILRSGMLQPIVVRYHEGVYQIVVGERRWRAAKQCGMSSVPVVIRKADDEQMVELALIENIQREDLNPIDRAAAYRSFCDRFHLKADEVAERLGEDRSTVSNYMRLLDLPCSIRDLVSAGQLGMGHARCLLGVADDRRRTELAESAARHELSVRALEDIVRRDKAKVSGRESGRSAGRLHSPHLRELQTRFEQALRTKVTIHEGKRKGSGRIVIEYFSLDDFDRVAERLGVSVE